jgi:undecaprenyl-diphosphatase
MIEAIILGIIQGLTEFLPVSSSAHLILIPTLLGWDKMGVAFDVALHFGTTLAVIGFFLSDIRKMIVGLYRLIVGGGTEEERKFGKLSLLIILSMIPAGFAGVFLKSHIESVRDNYLLISTMLVLVGILLYKADRASNLEKEVDSLTPAQVLLIGLAQACALIPGVSRSGATMLCALFLGMKRDEAARFSFLMAIPVILGGTILATKDLLEVGVSGEFMTNLVIGTLAAAFSGFLCIKYFLAFLRQGGFTPFAIYRVLIGICLFSYFYFGVIR